MTNRIPLLAMLPLLATACERGREAPAGVLTPIATPAPVRSGEPNLVTGPDDRAYLTWIEPRPDSAHALRWTVLDGEAWAPPITIAEGRPWFVNWADFPALVVLPRGRMAAHWLQKSGDATYAYDVRVSRSADGGRTWTAGTVPHGDGIAAEHGFVAMWAGAADSVGLVWLDGRDYAGKAEGDPAAQTQLRTATVAADGRASQDAPLDARTCDCCQNSAALTSRGPLVVYRDRTAEEIRDIYSVRRVNGVWSEPRRVHADNWHVEFCPVNGPAVAASGERAVVAWFTAADSLPRVMVAFSDDGGESWGMPARVDGGNPSGRVDVEILENGAVVSWLEQVGGGAEIRVRRVERDGRMRAPRAISGSSAARNSGFPRMTRAGARLVFAWTVPGDSGGVRTAALPVEGL